jgi:transposase
MERRKIRLKNEQQRRLLEHFVAGTTARVAASLVGVHRNSAAYFYQRVREVLVEENQQLMEQLGGEIELDESYFGGHRKGLRGRGAAGKVPVFGILKRGGLVYAKVVPDATRQTLFPIIKEKALPDSIVYTDSLTSYYTLNTEGFIHHRINHSETFAEKHNHINGI